MKDTMVNAMYLSLSQGTVWQGRQKKKKLTITRMLSAMWEAVSITSDYVTVNISAVSVFP